MDIQLKKFDPSKIGNDKVVCIVSKRGGGKTTLATDIMYHKRDIPSGIVMSGTEGSNRHWQKFVPSLFVYESFNKPALRALLKNQKKLCKIGKAQSCFVVMDDCVYDRSVMRDPCMREIALNGRHMKIFLLFISQYSMDVTPDIRSNIDYVFALRENIIMNRERLYRNYFGVIPTFEAFCEILDQCTRNYECLVVDHTSESNRIEDVIFWYKATPRETFSIGCPRFWNYARANFNKNYHSDSDDETFGPKKVSNTRVKKLGADGSGGGPRSEFDY
eukprot:jgi/Mesvir1/23359/Mv21054-RA.1